MKNKLLKFLVIHLFKKEFTDGYMKYTTKYNWLMTTKLGMNIVKHCVKYIEDNYKIKDVKE